MCLLVSFGQKITKKKTLGEIPGQPFKNYNDTFVSVEWVFPLLRRFNAEFCFC
jgi:hypothetical protein